MTDLRSENPAQEMTVFAEPYLADETACADNSAAESVQTEDSAGTASSRRRRHVEWTKVTVFGLLPAAVLVAALGAGYLKWQNAAQRTPQDVAESVRAATETAVAMLSYAPDTAQKDLGGAQDRLTGSFRDSYANLVNNVVIPAAKQKHVSAEATNPAAALVSATDDHAVVLVFIDQTTTIGQDPPTTTASSVRMSLDKVHGRWLVSGFDPV